MKSKLLFLVLLTSLSGQFVIGQSNFQKIKNLISRSPKINVPNPSDDVILAKHSTGFSGRGESRFESFEEKKKLTQKLEKIVAFNPNADALFPGSLIQGLSLTDGVLSPIKTVRTPLTITVTDLNNSNLHATFSKKVTDPSLANITDAVSQILNKNLQSEQPARIAYTQTAMNSIEEGFLRLGASAKWMAGSVSGSFQTSSTEIKSSFMVRLVQSYYTVSCEPPSSPSSFISTKTKYDDIKNYITVNNPPTYISSVTYGRELWLLIESNYEATEMTATLHAAFNGGFASGKADLDANQKKILSESSIQILALGGSGTPAVKLLTGDKVSELKNYLLAGANYSKTSPGVIISYTARYLKDNDVARVSSSTDYTIRTSQKSPETIFVTALQVTWRTTGDNKDWNTQPVVDVYDINGRHVGHIDCCSADRNSDDWGNGREETRNLTILASGLKLEDMNHGRFTAIRNPKGGDDWDYNATIYMTTSDGQRLTLSTCGGRNSCSTSW